jgi:hypothetical protein
MLMRSFIAVAATSVVLPLSASMASAVTLDQLVLGTTLTQGDVTFSGFKFDDFFGDDETGGLDDRINNAFPGDRSVDASQIDISTSATSSTVSLTATINPAISIAGEDATSGFPNIYDFFLDFTVSVSGSSVRTLDAVTLGGGDLFASGAGVSEVIFDIAGIGGANDLEIFEAPGFNPASATSDTETLASVTSLNFLGQIEGDTKVGATAGISTFTITFDLGGTAPPPPHVIPVPAGLPLLLTGLIGLGIARRARRG